MADSAAPRYRRIRDSIAHAIARRQWRPDEAIPTESELAKTYNVAIGTVRKAVDHLVSDGLVERVHGKGTFVRRPSFSNSLFRFFRYATEGKKLLLGGRLLQRRRLKPPPEIRKALRLNPKQQAIHMKRHRTMHNKIVLIEDIWLPADRFKGILEVEPASLEPLLYPAYETLFNVVVFRAEETLWVSQASAALAKILGIAAGAPVMSIERCAFDQDDHPVEWRCSQGPAASFQYKIEVR